MRQITLEYVVRNNTDRDLRQLFFPLKEFLVGLRVLDEDGRILNYLPNQEVEGALDEVRSETPALFDRLIGPWGNYRYQICVVFPPDSPLKPGQIRTVRFVHTDGTKPEYVRWSFFKLPSYNVEHERPRVHSHSLFVDIQAPQDTRLSVSVEDEQVREDDHYYVTLDKEIAYHFSVHLPAARREPYTWTATYTIGPGKVEAFVLSVWWLLSLGVGAWIISAFVSSQIPSLDPSGMVAIAAGASATTAALLLSLKASWADRYRLLLVPGFVATAMAWLLWAQKGHL